MYLIERITQLRKQKARDFGFSMVGQWFLQNEVSKPPEKSQFKFQQLSGVSKWILPLPAPDENCELHFYVEFRTVSVYLVRPQFPDEELRIESLEHLVEYL